MVTNNPEHEVISAGVPVQGELLGRVGWGAYDRDRSRIFESETVVDQAGHYLCWDARRGSGVEQDAATESDSRT
jgi:hypothetical protein